MVARKFCKSNDRREDVVEIVSKAAGQYTESLHFLGLPKGRFRLFLLSRFCNQFVVSPLEFLRSLADPPFQFIPRFAELLLCLAPFGNVSDGRYDQRFYVSIENLRIDFREEPRTILSYQGSFEQKPCGGGHFGHVNGRFVKDAPIKLNIDQREIPEFLKTVSEQSTGGRVRVNEVCLRPIAYHLTKHNGIAHMVKQIFIDIRHTHLLMHSFLEDSCGTIVLGEERKEGGRAATLG
ncbi:MAG: hypothetical protein A4E57_04139 [Syntrophorhabdaceae bacterium PtaU1.Bin034]|nr:MAG: hypothetical protein A4E57_04139 [Syntrophorhabdaceae bacterium PtaU1.Bin034]